MTLADELYEDIRACRIVTGGRIDLLRVAANCAASVRGAWLEFGVYRGSSAKILCESFPSRLLFGFDSFEGLPEVWQRVPGDQTHPVGHFALQADQIPNIPGLDLTIGHFEETLEPFLANLGTPIGFVHIDSDLYSSARTILGLLTPHLSRRAVLLFDELVGFDGRYTTWREGEWKALIEWAEQTHAILSPIARTEHEQVAIRFCGYSNVVSRET